MEAIETTTGPAEVYTALKALFPQEINPADLWNILKGIEGLCAVPSESYDKVCAWQQELDSQFLQEEDESLA